MTAPTPALAAMLSGPSMWHTIEALDETTSTNDVAAARSADGVPAGLVVTADRQTSGRGRLGRTWEDHGAHRSLLVSVLVDAPPRNVTLVPLAAGVALADALRRRGARAQLKWPNDVLLPAGDELRKCAGILVERHGDRIVVGMGLNVDWRGVPGDADRAGRISVAEVLDADVDRWEVLVDLLRALEAWLADLGRDPVRLLASYRTRCTTLGRAVRVTVPSGDAVEGVAIDVTGDGALRLRTDAGEVAVSAGDVAHVRPA